MTESKARSPLEEWPIRPYVCLALNRMGIFDWNLDEVLIHMDGGALEVFDLDPDEFTSLPSDLGRRVPEEEASRLYAMVQQAVEDGSAGYGAYFRLRRRDGTMQWTHTQGRILRDEAGTARRIVGIVRDAGGELRHVLAREAQDEERRRQAGLVEALSESLANASTVREVISVLTGARGMGRLGAVSLQLAMVEDGRVRLLVHGTVRTPESEVTRLEDPLPMNEAMRTQRPLFLTSPQELVRRYPAMRRPVEALKVTAAGYLPLTARGTSLGGLGLLFWGKREFPPEERNLLRAISVAIAQGLRGAVLSEQEHDLAESLQQAMLPRGIPRVEGACVAVRYRSARVGRDVGGDWYDVISLPGGRVAAVIGDVQGHDTRAATLMGQLRIVLRAYAAEGHPVAAVMSRASAFLRDLEGERFATCLYVEHDPATGSLRMVRAGHLAPVVRAADGTSRVLAVPGALPLGVAAQFGEREWPVHEGRLERGDTLLMCTDGLIERPGWDVDEGMRTLAGTLSEGPAELEELADWLAGVRGHGPDEDDMALVLLRRD
ncbi:SpoIIE family protein phosphatase [Streptomyces hoynatensis]|uniref:protein-serine/threonine phosphatase n=1 Tax=Streptomyces hoynatensis TaxID=1141874 RepID=A0A3A9Z971_9ACTN|nr:SpoIIE family protein phosphatase [Streptomyces hoynatensis]RKN43847.1 PAS domain S-box protein [Streptomyces hoynatensis]